ncbi:MAG: hypothetical protein KTR31_23135 [Myxococcales bacterium]|nr:hypothetical protein [Myxococcales bacterium]
MELVNGPLSTVGQQVLRGPVVRIGANPGPGGFKLAGYRGLDARQCVITAYEGGIASVAPVGQNQVRLAPHANVRWQDIDPLNDTANLTPGCVLHLGPVGRGATLTFVSCQRLGVWQEGQLASEAADVDDPGPVAAPGGGPAIAAVDARKVGRIRTSLAPVWFLGCAMLIAVTSASTILLAGVFQYLNRDVAVIGPEGDGYEMWESVDLEQATLDLRLLEGLEQPYMHFVVRPNMEAAGRRGQGLEERDAWDERFFQFVSASVERHGKAWRFFRRLEAVRVEYGRVVLALRDSELPEVFAAMPYQESLYQSAATSEVCAKGWWQFMPEVAHRLNKEGLDFRVADCRFRGNDSASWSPTDTAPPPNVRKNGAYMDGGACMIDRCRVDDRTDLRKATAAAIFTLEEAFRDPLLRQSGSAVQLTMTSHNAGYDDERFGRKYRKAYNVRPAYKKWLARNPGKGSLFTGQNIKCRSHADKGTCGGAYLAETQHYAYTIVAQHFLAVCYYAQNYGQERAFAPWRLFTSSDGYCSTFDVPSRAEVLAGSR